jgi:hypothetical protein
MPNQGVYKAEIRSNFDLTISKLATLAGASQLNTVVVLPDASDLKNIVDQIGDNLPTLTLSRLILALATLLTALETREDAS